MTPNSNFSENESLLLIQQMISIAKDEQKDDGRGWIIWGWLLLLASVFTYINLDTKWVATFFFWNLFGLLAIILMVFEMAQNRFLKKKRKVVTYTAELFAKLNGGFFLFLALIIVSINMGVPPVKGFSVLIALYSFWMLIYGAALRFKPSIYAAYFCWGLAFAGLWVPNNRFDITMILHGVAILAGYIIPGYIARREFYKLKQKANVSTGV